MFGIWAEGNPFREGSLTLRPPVSPFPGEGYDCPEGQLPLGDAVVDGQVVVDGPVHPVGHDHGPGLAAHQPGAEDGFVEVVNHDLGLGTDRVLVALDIVPETPLGPPGVELGVVVDLLDEVEVALDAAIVLEDVQDEPLLDGLLHRVDVEGEVLHRPVGLGRRLSEEFQGPVLRGCREGEVAGVAQHAPACNDPVDLVLVILLFLLGLVSQSHVHLGRGPAPIAGVGFVDDDGEPPLQVLLLHGVQDEGELLDGGRDDPLALGD